MVQPLSNQKVKADIARNRLTITISGKVSKQICEKLYTDVRFCVADLKTGFDVITDLRGCNLGHLSGIPTFLRIRNHLACNGAGEIVRVVQENRVIFKQMMNHAKKVQGYKPVYVPTLEEAETLLAKAVKRDGLRFRLHNADVVYKTNGQERRGRIVNISTSGCCLETEQKQALMDHEILVQLSFSCQDQESILFDIQAQVVRKEDNGFAVKFMNFDSSKKEQLWECLLYEGQREF